MGNFEIFHQDILKTAFWMRIYTIDAHELDTFFQNQSTFLQNQGIFLLFSRKGRGDLSPSTR